jgi:hypothetical protein
MKLVNPGRFFNPQHWSIVKFTQIEGSHTMNQIEWAEKNGTNGYFCIVWDGYKFENEEDAVLFALKWL